MLRIKVTVQKLELQYLDLYERDEKVAQKEITGHYLQGAWVHSPTSSSDYFFKTILFSAPWIQNGTCA